MLRRHDCEIGKGLLIEEDGEEEEGRLLRQEVPFFPSFQAHNSQHQGERGQEGGVLLESTASFWESKLAEIDFRRTLFGGKRIHLPAGGKDKEK